jgi:hypothetical protein
MDLSFWSNIGTGVKYEPTVKQYYGKYLYKVTMEVPAGRILEKPFTDPESLIQDRMEHWRQINWGGSWIAKQRQLVDNADPKMLLSLQQVKTDYVDQIKFRVEEPKLTIYAYNEQTMMDIVSNYLTTDMHTRVKTVSGPESEAAAEALTAGAIIKRSEYKYKVTLRDGKYSLSDRQSLVAYLDGIGDTKLTPACRSQLMRSTNYIWSCYFFCNDSAICQFINLIVPNAVLNIHELVAVDK